MLNATSLALYLHVFIDHLHPNYPPPLFLSCPLPDEIDAIGTKRYDAHSGGEREIQRTMLELLNQLDGFDAMSEVKVRRTFVPSAHIACSGC